MIALENWFFDVLVCTLEINLVRNFLNVYNFDLALNDWDNLKSIK